MQEVRLRNPQSHIPREQLRERVKMARLYVDLTRAMCEMAFSKRAGASDGDLEALLTLLSVFIGDAEGRLTTATKIATHSGLARATVYRRLDQLIKLKKVVRIGRNYYLAEGAVTPDKHRRLSRILERFREK